MEEWQLESAYFVSWTGCLERLFVEHFVCWLFNRVFRPADHFKHVFLCFSLYLVIPDLSSAVV